jgi:hypothetical protein
MSEIELISIIASIASLILAIVAITLSIVFFKMSSDLTGKSTEAAKGINASVEKLEGLFDKLYNDTFSMMRDTYSDIRKHMWPEESTSDDKITNEIEKRADVKIKTLKDEMGSEISRMLNNQRVTEDKLLIKTKELEELVDKAIAGSRKVEVEAREETFRDALLNFIQYQERISNGHVYADEIVGRFRDRYPIGRIIEELEKMEKDGIISLSDKDINPQTSIRYIDKKRHNTGSTR